MNKTQLKTIVMTAAVALSGALFAADKSSQAAKLAPRVESVVVDTVGEGSDTMNRSFSGTIVAINTYDIIPRVSGDIISQGFKDGEYVKKGQLLFQIEDVRYKAAVKASQAKIEKIKAQLDYHKSDFARKDELYKKNAVSRDSWENSKSTLASLQADLHAAEAEFILAQDDLNHTRITALYDGKTSKSPFPPGSYITPASGMLNRVVDMSQLRTKFSLGMKDYLTYFGNEQNFRANAKVELILADGSVYPHPGKVEIVDNVSLVESADALRIWVRFPNPEAVLSPGGAVTIKLSKDDPKKYPAVPISALVHDKKGIKLYVVNDQNTVEERRVTIGSSDGKTQIIYSGVKAGEKVITEGTHKIIMPGVKVNPIPAKEGK